MEPSYVTENLKFLEELKIRNEKIRSMIGKLEAFPTYQKSLRFLEEEVADYLKQYFVMGNRERNEDLRARMDSVHQSQEHIMDKITHDLEKQTQENHELAASLDLDMVEKLTQHSSPYIQKKASSLLDFIPERSLLVTKYSKLTDAVEDRRYLRMYQNRIQKLKEEVVQYDKSRSGEAENTNRSVNKKKYEEQLESISKEISLSQSKEELHQKRELIHQLKLSLEKDESELDKDAFQNMQMALKEAEAILELQEAELEYRAIKELENYQNTQKKKDDIQVENKKTNEKETSQNYQDNTYDFYNLNQINQQVSAFKQEQSVKVTPNQYIDDPLAYFDHKIEEVIKNTVLIHSFRERIVDMLKNQKEEFTWNYSSYIQSPDPASKEQVLSVLTSCDQKINIELKNAANLAKTNPLVRLDRMKEGIIKDATFPPDSILEMSEYIDRLKSEFIQKFGYENTKNQEMIDEYMKIAQNLILNKKAELQNVNTNQQARTL